MNEPVVQVERLSHSYPSKLALDCVSFDCFAGESFALLGPNGSGKSTLFRVLSTLVGPQLSGTDGASSVRIFGLDLSAHTPAVRSGLGVIFQSPALDHVLTVSENLSHHGHLYGLRGRELAERIGHSLEQLNLTDRAGDRVGTLSGGLRRKVELAKCLLTRPKLLIMDEPSTGLDPGARLELWQHLDRVRTTDGTTILLTTHLMDEAERCFVAILDRGRLVACGAPEALKSNVGAFVITLTSDRPAELQDAIRSRLSIECTTVGSSVRIEHPDGHALIPRLIECGPALVNSVSASKPTLEDVFLKLTGAAFRAGDEAT